MRSPRSQIALAVALLLLAAGCTDGGGGDGAATTAPASSTTAASSSTTSTIPSSAIDCDERRDEVLGLVAERLDQARLTDGGDWLPAEEPTQFDDRTYDAESFRDHVDLPCALRVVQRLGDDERLVLVAWTTERYGFVAQATDAPSEPYAPAARFELLLERPYGEYLEDPVLWATTLEDGTTVVVGALDMSLGAFAKAWQSAWPPLPDGEPTLESQTYAIELLRAMGNEGVTIAEEAEPGSSTGTVMFVTPAGLIALATVSPDDGADPAQPWLSGATTTEEVDGTTLFVTEPGEGQYDVGEVGFTCGDHVWRLHSSFGDLRELADLGGAIVRADGCEPAGPPTRSG